MSARVGVCGLGIMGSRMAASLRRAGLELTVWNRSAGVAARFAADHGARAASSPAEVASSSDIVVTVVADAEAVRAVLLGPEGVASGAQPGTLCVDCSTIGAIAARELAGDLRGRGLRLVDAPVSGSAPRATDGTLTIMAGGSPEDVEDAQPVLEAMGELIVHVGEAGQGQAVKVVNNALAAANAVAVGEALLLAGAAGVDLDALQRVVGAGSGASAMLELKAGVMRRHDLDPLFKLDHMLKDVRLCLADAEAVGVGTPFAERAQEVLAGASQRGLGDRDFAALICELEDQAGHRLP